MKKITFTKKALALFLAIAMVLTGLYIPKSNVRIVNAEEETEAIEVVEETENTGGIVGDDIAPENASARIGDAYFESFQNAVSAARTATSDVTITLLNNATVSTNLTVSNSNKKTITIDGDNKSYTITTSKANALVIEDTDAKVVFQDVTLNHTATQSTLYVKKTSVLELNNVDINAIDIEDYQYALINLFGTENKNGDNTKENMTLNMTDVTVTMTGIRVLANTEEDVKNNQKSEVHAVVRAGNGGGAHAKTVQLNMTRCTFDITDSPYVHGMLFPGTSEANITMTDCTIDTENTVPLQINSSKYSINKTRCSLSIASTENLQHYNSSGTKAYFTATYGTDAVPVAQVGRTLYADFKTAASNATAGSTVDLLADVTIGTSASSESGQIQITRAIVIDGNQHKITTKAKHSFEINAAISVCLKNIEFDCKQYQNLIQVNSAASVALCDIDITAAAGASSNLYYQYGFISTMAAAGTTTNLEFTRVNVLQMKSANSSTTNDYGFVRTGNGAAMTVNITLNNCNWNLTEATNRKAIAVTKDVTANITINDSSISTDGSLGSQPIYAGSNSKVTLTKTKCTLTNETYEAQIGNTLKPTLADALSTVKTSNKDVTVEILKDIEIKSATDVLNDYSIYTTFDGNSHTITTSGSANTFLVKGTPNGTGTYEFKNMNVNHKTAGILFQLNQNDVKTTNEETGEQVTTTTHTSKKATLKLTNIDVVNANNGGKNWGLITTVPYGTDSDIHLDLYDVDVTLTFTVSVVNNGAAVIRTGGDQERNITIDLNKCNFNVQDAAVEEGNKTIYGIYVTGKTEANINLTDSNITTKSFAPIQANSNAGTDNTITFSGDCKLDSSTATYKAAPIQGYDAQVGNKVYRTFATAIAEAGAGATVEVLQDLSTGWRDITKSMTIDGNGYEITSTAGDANNKFLFVVKDDATEFKLKDLDIKHLRRGMVVRTDIPTTVTLENVDIDATEAPVSTEYALFNLTAEGTTNLIWNDVTVDMDATTAGSDDNPAIIRTGNDGTKNINITLTDCNLNTEGAAGRHGIVIMSGATATLNLTGTTITTLDVVPIKDNTGSATINTTDCTLTYTGIEAIIGDNLYKTFAEALTAANALTENATIQILKDIEIGAVNEIKNPNGASITIEGYNHELVLNSTGGSHTFVIKKPQTGMVEFKNMTIVHKNYGSAVQIAEDISSEELTVKLTDVTITATESEDTEYGYWHAIINVLKKQKTNLILEDVDITMATELPGYTQSPYYGIIRTGNTGSSNAKTVNMTLKNCKLDATGAAGRHGIVVVDDTTANITLENTEIKTDDVAPIKNYSTTSQKLTMDDECIFEAAVPIEGYVAQIDNVLYTSFNTARVAANQAKDSVTIKLLENLEVSQDVWINNENGKTITIDGNGHEVSTLGGSYNHVFRIDKDCTVILENMTVYHKNMGSLVQVTEKPNMVNLTLSHVTIYANNPENDESNYRHALFNIMSSTTINLVDVNVTMATNDVAGNDYYPGIIRTGNHGDAEKDVTINVHGGVWNTEGATGRHGIVITKKTNAVVNLYGASITTADAAPIADYSQKAVITKDEDTITTCTGDYKAYLLVVSNSKDITRMYENFAEAVDAANQFGGDATVGLLQNIVVKADVNVGNANGKLQIDGNGYVITTESGNHTFTVDKNKEVEFRNLTIIHKRYGTAIRVTSAGATLTLTNVFIDARYASELTNPDKTYNYTLVNLEASSTLNMKNSRLIMEVEKEGAGGGKQSALIRTGNSDEKAGTYKEVTINLTDCELDARNAENRFGILIVDADVQLNLKGNTKILTGGPTEEHPERTCKAIGGHTGTLVAKISVEETCLLQTGDSTAWADVVDADIAGGITDACVWTYVLYENLDAFRTETGFTAPKTIPVGYVFAGWYTDKACTGEYALAATDTEATSAYAKFVPEHVLSVKAQISENLIDENDTNDAKGDIRFVTTVDNLDYYEVGFTYTIVWNGQVLKSGESKSDLVYKTLYAVGTNGGEKIDYTPEYDFCAESQYFKTMTIKNVPQSAFGAEITVTPFWKTLDGTTVYGEPVTKTVQQGIDAEDGNIPDEPETAKVYTNRVVMVSDLHYTTSMEKAEYDAMHQKYDPNNIIGQFFAHLNPNASYAAGNAFGYTQEGKLQAALDDIHAYGDSVGGKVDAVMILGDLTLDDYGYRNLVDNYLDDFKTNFMGKLLYKPYAIAGNHDSYTNTEWQQEIGTDRQYSVKIEESNAVFIMLDTFAAKHAEGASGSEYIGINVEWLEKELEKYPTETIFLCTHYYQEGKHPEKDAALNTLMKQNPRIVSLFRAHSHMNTTKQPASLAGSPIVDIGGYAYNGQEENGVYDFNIFNKAWAWGYQVVEWNEDEVHIYHVKPMRDYTDSAGKVHNYKGAIEDDIVIKLK